MSCAAGPAASALLRGRGRGKGIMGVMCVTKDGEGGSVRLLDCMCGVCVEY